jgi:hypothetical protein
MLAFFLEQKSKNGKYEALMFFLSKIVNINDILIQNDSDFEIKREENNIDLTIKLKVNNSLKNVFIENKIKSIPTSKQLKDYEEKLGSDNHLILITPIVTSTRIVSENRNWLFITYSNEILSFLQALSDFEYDNEDIKFVIQKYKH